MEADHFDRTLTAFRRRVPSRSFTVALVNGDRFEVDHPDALVIRDGWRCSSGRAGCRCCSTTKGRTSSSAT